jgi:hypothetical protein
MANLLPIEIILTFIFLSPAYVFFINTIKPRTFAIPSPDLPVPIISTVYSLPSSTDFGDLMLIILAEPHRTTIKPIYSDPFLNPDR